MPPAFPPVLVFSYPAMSPLNIHLRGVARLRAEINKGCLNLLLRQPFFLILGHPY